MTQRREKEVDVAKLALLFIGFVVILAILLVSYRIRRCHLSRTYTIALFCAYLPAQMAHPVVILIYGMQDYDLPMRLEWPERLYTLFLNFSHSQYEMNSLIFLLLACLLYAKLSFTTTVLSEHKFPLLFFGSYCGIFFFVTLHTIFDGIFDHYHGHALVPPRAIKPIRDYLFYALQLLRAVPYVLIWVLIVIAIAKLIWDSKTERKVEERRLFAKNRKLLISAICFLVIPQLLHFLAVAPGCIDVYRRVVGRQSVPVSLFVLKDSFLEWSFHAKQFRIVVLGLSAIIIFPPYRTAVFGCRIRHVSVVPMETQSHPSFCQCVHCITDQQLRSQGI